MQTSIREIAKPYFPALRIVRSIGRSIVERKFRWSYMVEDYYPIVPRSRWMTGALPYNLLHKAINQNRAEYETFLDNLESIRDLLHSVKHAEVGNEPFWNNGWFTALDAAALMCMLAWKKPKRYIEIGSGNSTRFAAYTIASMNLDTQITSIDPNPRVEIDRLCTRTIRSPLENCDLSVFDELESGDILFFDGSHRIFSNSDVMVFFFELMPRLKPGVIVHIHDIFLPDDYPAHWNKRLYTEQYLLAAMLMCNPPFRVIVPAAFMCRDKDLSKRVKSIFASSTGQDIPMVYRGNDGENPPGSFWIEMT